MGKVDVAPARLEMEDAAAVSSTAPESSTLAHPEGPAVKLHGRRRASLPGPIRFILIVILSLAFSSLGHSLITEWSQGELGSIARIPESDAETVLLTVWKVVVLALGWFGDYDGYDLAALALLAQGPTAYLTSEFYGLRTLTAGAYLVVEVVSAFLPFLLLRHLSGAHSAAPGVPNGDIVVDRGIQVLTSLLASITYSVVLFLACRTFLPTTLVLGFEGIPTIEPAADAVLLGFGSPATQVLFLLFGLAARTFIFTPTVTTPRTIEDEKADQFDPATASLGQTVAWNLWGYTTQTKVSILRTAVAMLVSGVSTYLQCWRAINGVESYGAAAYASIWVLAAMVTGLSLRYVGSI